MLSVGVDHGLRQEFVTLGCNVVKVTDEPLIGDLVLFADPAFMEKCHPDHHYDSVDKTKRCVEPLVGSISVRPALEDHRQSKHETNDHDRDQPARVMNEPRKVEGHLLSVVVFDNIERLHVVEEVRRKHAD